jgi:hypothetical protein
MGRPARARRGSGRVRCLRVAAARLPVLLDLSHQRRVHDQVPERPDRGHVPQARHQPARAAGAGAGLRNPRGAQGRPRRAWAGIRRASHPCPHPSLASSASHAPAASNDASTKLRPNHRARRPRTLARSRRSPGPAHWALFFPVPAGPFKPQARALNVLEHTSIHRRASAASSPWGLDAIAEPARRKRPASSWRPLRSRLGEATRCRLAGPLRATRRRPTPSGESDRSAAPLRVAKAQKQVGEGDA